MIDFYKATHAEQYPKGMTRIYSPGTCRLSRLKDIDKVTYFGGQAFAKEFLIKTFNEYFFNRSEDEVVKEYNRILTYTLGEGTYSDEKIRRLHQLGYLPIAMYTIPEGMSTKIGVPQSVFVNTHPDFAWLTNTLETAYSAFIWHIQISVEVGKRYRKIVEKYMDLVIERNEELQKSTNEAIHKEMETYPAFAAVCALPKSLNFLSGTPSGCVYSPISPQG